MSKIIVTGSEGMIGKELMQLLEKEGHNVLKIDIRRNWVNGEKCYECGTDKSSIPMDITNKDLMEEIISIFKPDEIYHLFGIKGSPIKTQKEPVDFMYPMLVGDANIIYLAQKYNVKKVLYTSSIAVENPQTDVYPAWAKMTAEKLIEAMRIQYPGGTKYCIVRPANVYGRFDNFEAEYPMVITNLIRKGLHDDEIHVHGDGSEIRDFINAKDVARGMIQVMNKMPKAPVNLCSGKGVSIKEIARIISKETKKPLVFEPHLASGDKKRVMKLNWDFKPRVDIEKGIKEVIEWRMT